MRKIIERLLVFFIGIPAVFALVFFLEYANHLALNAIVTVFSGIGAVELSSMLEKKQIKISKIEAFVLGCLAPLAATLIICFNLPDYLLPLLLMAGASYSVLSHIFSLPKNLDTVANRLAGYLSVMAYPGIFMYWIVKMTSWENPSAFIFLFLLLVFANDSFAWLFGSLFGKNNRGIIPASPNKSIAGFIGGLFGSLGVCTGALFLFPQYFPVERQTDAGVLTVGIILGVFTGLFATFGDLAESAIKRSSGFKDSGNIILGRGGILDSIDSIAIAAPVYYMLLCVFFSL